MDAHRFNLYAKRNPAAPAVVDPQGRQWSRRELASTANSMSRALRHAGLAPGDVLAIIAPNCFEYLSVYLAATQIGLYVVPVNWHLSAPEIQYILENCQARAIFAHERFASAMTKVLQFLAARPAILVAHGTIPDFQTIERFTAGASTAPLEDPVMGRPLLYTSATTGKPKGVVLPLADAERVLDHSIQKRLEVGSFPEMHVYLCVSMLYHGAPLDVMAIALHLGNTVVLTDAAVAPEQVLQLIEQHQVTQAYMVPTLFGRLLGLEESVRSRYSLASLKRIVHTGAPCPIIVKRRMIGWLGPILSEMYGATEGAGTTVESNDWLQYPGTVGKPIAGTRLRILNEDGEELPPGAIGTIYMTRWMGDRFRYLGDPEKTRASQLGDFFTAGDLGYVNEEGFLFICDRKIDLIIRSGTKIYPAEIENVLTSHPTIADCAVFGVPDEFTGEAAMAVVQLRPAVEADRDLKLQLLRFIAQQLSPTMVPRYLVFTPQLPREATGKLQKRRLRDLYWKDGAAQASG